MPPRFLGAGLRLAASARIWVIALAVISAAIAAALSVSDFRNILDVFELADPTGGFGRYFHIGGLAANLAVIFVGFCVVLSGGRNFRLRYALVVFVPPILEALSGLPCFLVSHPAALCGIGLVFVYWMAIPIVLIAALIFVLTAHRRTIAAAGLTAMLAFLACVGAAQALLAPSRAEQCRLYPEVTRRSNCLMAFADRGNDTELCRSIEFRTTRFTCLGDIALAKRDASLCGEIADASPLAPYESPAALYRDACFQNLAYAKSDRGLCGKIENKRARAGCERSVRTPQRR